MSASTAKGSQQGTQRSSAGSNNSNSERNSNSNSNNGTSRRTSEPKGDRVNLPPVDTAAYEQHARVLFVLANVVGATTELTTTDGVVYDGIFSSASAGRDVGVRLRVARRRLFASDMTTATARDVAVDARDISSLSATSINTQTVSVRANTNKNSFQTDTAISGTAAASNGRSLQKWDFADGAEGSLTAGSKAAAGSWDQFAANEKLFGVTTDFNEELYTTKLDVTSENYQKRREAAERLAREIEQGPTDNIHIAEERNLPQSSGSGGKGAKHDEIDEEDRYSSVIRTPGKYVPPSARKGDSPAPIKEEKTTTKGNEDKVNTGTNAAKPTTTSVATLAQIAQRRGQDVPKDFAPVDIENVSRDFKEYSKGEKDHLTELKAQAMAGTINEFKNFSQNLNKKLPLLAKKEGETQQEGAKDTQAESKLDTDDKKKENDTEEKAPKTETEAEVATESKDANKESFKFNLEAAEFVPDFGSSGGQNNSNSSHHNHHSHHNNNNNNNSGKRKISGGSQGYNNNNNNNNNNGKYNKNGGKYNKHYMNHGMGGQFHQGMAYGAAPYGYYPAGGEGYPMPAGGYYPPYGAYPYGVPQNGMPFMPMPVMPYGAQTGVNVPVQQIIPPPSNSDGQAEQPQSEHVEEPKAAEE